jgi:hypothetical protein
MLAGFFIGCGFGFVGSTILFVVAVTRLTRQWDARLDRLQAESNEIDRKLEVYARDFRAQLRIPVWN